MEWKKQMQKLNYRNVYTTLTHCMSEYSHSKVIMLLEQMSMIKTLTSSTHSNKDMLN